MAASSTLTLERRLSPDQAERRANVRRAARALAAEGGYPAVTMQAVAERSGVARATIYRYFASKDHLLGEVILAWGGELTADLRRDPPRGATAGERVSGALRRVLEAARAEPRLTRAVLTSATSEDPEALRAQERFAGIVDGYLAAALGPDSPPRPEAAELIGHVFFSALVHTSSGRLPFDRATTSLDAAARLLFDSPDPGETSR